MHNCTYVKFFEKESGYDKVFKQFEEKHPNTVGQFIFRIRYKYDEEDEWDITNQFVWIDTLDAEWEVDWWEGQDFCELIGYIRIDDIPENIFTLIQDNK